MVTYKGYEKINTMGQILLCVQTFSTAKQNTLQHMETLTYDRLFSNCYSGLPKGIYNLALKLRWTVPLCHVTAFTAVYSILDSSDCDMFC